MKQLQVNTEGGPAGLNLSAGDGTLNDARLAVTRLSAIVDQLAVAEHRPRQGQRRPRPVPRMPGPVSGRPQPAPGSDLRSGRAGRRAACSAWVRARVVTPPAGETQPVRRRRLSDTTRPWRGGIVAFLGGAIIVLVAMTISPGLLQLRGGRARTGDRADHLRARADRGVGAAVRAAARRRHRRGRGRLVPDRARWPDRGCDPVRGRRRADRGLAAAARAGGAARRAGARVDPARRLRDRPGDPAVGASLFLRGVADDAVGKNNPILSSSR